MENRTIKKKHTIILARIVKTGLMNTKEKLHVMFVEIQDALIVGKL
jgi:hypothetical protein